MKRYIHFLNVMKCALFYQEISDVIGNDGDNIDSIYQTLKDP